MESENYEKSIVNHYHGYDDFPNHEYYACFCSW